jgi:hypothetical protein
VCTKVNVNREDIEFERKGGGIYANPVSRARCDPVERICFAQPRDKLDREVR